MSFVSIKYSGTVDYGFKEEGGPVILLSSTVQREFDLLCPTIIQCSVLL